MQLIESRLNLNIGSCVLKVLTDNTNGTGKNVFFFNFSTLDYSVSKIIQYGALDSVRDFSVVIVGSKSSKRQSEPHPCIQPPCYIYL